jgi:hypothetical protein
MHPRDVKSPVSRTRNHRKLFMSPKTWTEDDPWSLCEVECFDASTDKWDLRVGIRWDGDRSSIADKGFPNSSGQAVWFVLPRPIERIVRAAIGTLELMRKVEKLTQKRLKKKPEPSGEDVLEAA